MSQPHSGEPRSILIPYLGACSDLLRLQGLIGAIQRDLPRAVLHILFSSAHEGVQGLFAPPVQWLPVNQSPAQLPDCDLVLGVSMHPRPLELDALRRALSAGARGYCLSSFEAPPPPLDGIVPVRAGEFTDDLEKHQALLSAIGLGRLAESRFALPPESAETPRFLSELGLESGRYVVISNGAWDEDARRQWPPQHAAELAVRVERETGLGVLFVGLRGEEDSLAATVRAAYESGARPIMLALESRELARLAVVLAHARGVVSTDTPPLHLAGALGLPAVGLFGAGDWPRRSPVGNVISIVAPWTCGRCNWHCLFGDAPCHQAAGPAEVYSALQRLLNGERGPLILEASAKPQPGPGDIHAASRLFASAGGYSLPAARWQADHALPYSIEALQADLSREKERADSLQRQLDRAKSDPFEWLVSVRAAEPVNFQFRHAAQDRTVSVIVPVYNGASFLARCLESIWRQTSGSYSMEILLCDDGSSDGSREVAREAISNSPCPARLLSHPGERNLGVSATRNLGLSESTGAFIALLDVDDQWLPEKTAVQLEYLAGHPDVNCLCSFAHNRNGRGEAVTGWNGKELAGDYSEIPPPEDFRPPYDFYQMLRGDPVVNSTVMMRRSVLEKTGVYPATLAHQAEDWLLFQKVSLHGPIHLIPQPLAVYTVHEQSYTARYMNEGLAFGARVEVLFQLLHWMLQQPEHEVMARWVYRRYLPRLWAGLGKGHTLIEDYYRKHNGDLRDVASFEDHLNGVYQELQTLRHYQKHIEFQLDVLRKIPGVTRAYQLALSLTGFRRYLRF